MDIVKEFFERRAGIAGFPVRRSARREKDELAAELGALRAELARVAEEKAPSRIVELHMLCVHVERSIYVFNEA